MQPYPLIERALQTAFNAEDGLSLEVAKQLYARAVAGSPTLKNIGQELDKAFKDPSVSWRGMLRNDRYEVYDFDSEEEAKAFAYEILVVPLKANE
jgi:hypothetical protein